MRHSAHRALAARLEAASDEELQRLLATTQVAEHGRAVLTLPADQTRVFVKLLPLTAFEAERANRGSTANVLRLPSYYQYRFGSCGFSAWREVETHRLTNGWVLSGASPGFPLLHHLRVLPIVARLDDDLTSMQVWGDSRAIRERMAAVSQATCSAALFLEYLPLTLNQWLGGELLQHPDPLALVHRVEDTLVELLEFTLGQGLLHMDTHLDNVLTDGTGCYLSDHGLALSRGFVLGADEQHFFERHRNYDLCTAISCLVYAIVIHYDSGNDWRRTLGELGDGSHDALGAMPVALRPYLAQRAPLAQAMGRFFRRLKEDLMTPYPSHALQRLLDRPRRKQR